MTRDEIIRNHSTLKEKPNRKQQRTWFLKVEADIYQLRRYNYIKNVYRVGLMLNVGGAWWNPDAVPTYLGLE